MEKPVDLSGAVVKPKNKGGAPKGRVISEATRAALQKGFEKLKSIREEKKRLKEEAVKKKAEEVEVNKEVINEVKNSNETPVAIAPLETPAIGKPKRVRMKTVSKTEFLSFKDDILSVIDKKLTPSVKVEAPVIAPPPAPAPPPAQAPVEKV